MLFYITSAPELSEISSIFTSVILDRGVNVAMNLAGWESVDDRLYCLAQQVTGEVTPLAFYLVELR